MNRDRNDGVYEKESAISFERVTPAMAEEYFALEQKLAGSKTYGTAERIEEALDEIEHSTINFIKSDGVTVGHIAYSIKSPGCAHISSLAVIPGYQGKGIARQALRKVLGELKNYPHIELFVHPENPRAIHLYESEGFVLGERSENHFGDGEPRVWMKLTR